MSQEPPSAEPGSATATVVAVLLSLGVPPSLVAALDYWPQVTGSPVLSALIWLAVSGLVFGLLYFVRLVFTQLVIGAAGRCANWLRDHGPGERRRRRRYLRQVRRAALRQDMFGVLTFNTIERDAYPELPDVYIDVTLDTGWASRNGERFEAEWSRPGWRPGERAQLEDFISHDAGSKHRLPDLFMVTGQPGSGKTAQLRHAALQRCDGESATKQIPVLLSLKDHVDSIRHGEPMLADLVAATASLNQVGTEWLNRHLERERCLVLLDGIDEVGDFDARREIAEWIRKQQLRYPNVFVVTSRPDGFVGTELEEFGIPLHMRTFTVGQTEQFLSNWYRAVGIRARDAATPEQATLAARAKAKQLQHEFQRDPALYDLASRPLLLTMIASVHYFRQELPGSRVELYDKICELLLSRQYHRARHKLRPAQRVTLIQRLALYMMEHNRSLLPPADAHRVVAEAMRHMDPAQPRVAPRHFIEDMVRVGLLAVGFQNSYEFPHATFMEYLAAKELKDRQTPPTAHVGQRRWRETIKLYCAMSDASRVVAACVESGGEEALWQAFECARGAHELSEEQRERLGNIRAQGDLPDLIRIYDNVDTTVQLGQSARVCARPIGEILRQVYLVAMSGRNRMPPPDFAEGPSREGAPAHGWWPEDVQAFVEWVNDLTYHDDDYRLPTPREAEDAVVTNIVDLSRHPVWVAGPRGPRLFRRDEVTHPFAVSRKNFAAHRLEDRRDTTGHLMLALGLLRAIHHENQSAVEAFGTGFEARLTQDVDAMLGYRGTMPLARVYDRRRRWNELLDHAQTPVTLPEFVKLVREGRFASWWDRHVRSEHGRPIRDELESLGHEITGRDGDVDPDVPLDRLLASSLARFSVLNSYPEVPPGTDLSAPLEWLSDTETVRTLAKHDLVSQRLVTPDFLVVRAYLLMLRSWLARLRAGQERPAEPVTHLDAHLADAVPTVPEVVYPGQIVPALWRALEQLDPAVSVAGEVEWIVRRVIEIVTPVLDRAVPYQATFTSHVRLGLAAGALACSETPGLESAATDLRHALYGIDILACRNEASILPNDVLLLAQV